MKYFVVDGNEYKVAELRPEDMDVILSDKERAGIVGYPCFWDSKGRVWPKSDIPIIERFLVQ